MWGNSIAGRVKKILARRIKEAQKEHDEECSVLDVKCDAEIMAAEDARDNAKEMHAEEMVNRIIGRN